MEFSEKVVAPVSRARTYTKLAGLAALMALVMVLGVVTPSAATDTRQGPPRGGAPSFEESQPVAVTSAPSITIVENAVPNAAQDFSFTGCQGAGCGPFTLNDDSDPALPNTVTGTGMAPGTYTITQAPGVNHWVLDDIFCDTGEDVDVENRTVTITLGAAEDVTCTFLNRSPSIQIIQDATPDAPQDFSFTGCQGAGCGPFTLDDDSDPALPNSVTASGLTPGIYTITQAETAGWPLASLSCNTGETVDLENRTVTVILGASEFARCTFTNRSNGIKIMQDTEPDDPTDFGYTGCLGSSCAHFDLDDDDQPTLPNSTSGFGLATGAYTITQDAVPGYDLLNITCDNHTDIDLAQRRVTIFMDGTQVTNCTFFNRPTPSPLMDVEQISAGIYHTCARLTDGEARCWGRNHQGQLGDGTTTNRNRAVVVSNPEGTGPLTDVAEISAGIEHTCARLTTGQVRCWGWNSDGRLGDGTTAGSLRPVAVLNTAGTGPLTDVAQISAGTEYTCARLTDGQARCWGWNRLGGLGDGTTAGSLRPVAVLNTAGTGPLTDVAEISVGHFHTCARLTNGEARCWGWNYRGGLGDGTTFDRTRPVVVMNPAGTGPLVGVHQIGAGSHHTCARVTRQVRCWGENDWGQLGDGRSVQSTRPVVVVDPLDDIPLTQVVELAVGFSHGCARLTNGEARCWGYGGDNQLGGGNGPSINPWPIVVANSEGTGPLADIARIDAGGSHTCAIVATGEARCWGYNSSGELGDGTTTERPRPIRVFTF